MLAYNFASKTYAYGRPEQGLSRSVSAILSLTREYLDPVVKTYQCAQYMADFGIIMLRILSGTFGQFSDAFATED